MEDYTSSSHHFIAGSGFWRFSIVKDSTRSLGHGIPLGKRDVDRAALLTGMADSALGLKRS